MLKKSTAAFMIIAALLCGSLLTLGVTGYSQIFGQAAGEGIVSSVLQVSGLKQKESQKLGTALSLIESNYIEDVDREKLIDGAINGMMEALGDPYSNYMGKETAEKFEESIEGSFSGIGAEVSSDNGKVVLRGTRTTLVH